MADRFPCFADLAAICSKGTEQKLQNRPFLERESQGSDEPSSPSDDIPVTLIVMQSLPETPEEEDTVPVVDGEPKEEFKTPEYTPVFSQEDAAAVDMEMDKELGGLNCSDDGEGSSSKSPLEDIGIIENAPKTVINDAAAVDMEMDKELGGLKCADDGEGSSSKPAVEDIGIIENAPKTVISARDIVEMWCTPNEDDDFDILEAAADKAGVKFPPPRWWGPEAY